MLTSAQFLQRLQENTAEYEKIEKLEQRSDGWLAARKGRITASNFGAAAGHNKYSSKKDLLKNMLWHTFKGNANTRWGQDHEETAFNLYAAHMLLETLKEYSHAMCEDGVELRDDPTPVHVEVVESGLYIRNPRYWMGNSPDGLVHVEYDDNTRETGLLEIKCPASRRLYSDRIPHYYMDQIQGTMGNMGLPWCDFVVWTPSEMQITRVPFDNAYWTHMLLPAITDFYFQMYVPAAVAKENNLLKKGQTNIPIAHAIVK